MGVRGLTTYINYNQDIFMQQYFLRDCFLVIDGNSLCAQLYRTLNGFSAFGGDYDKYAAHTKTFFKYLRKCNVTPFVIFDGSYVVKKLKTAYSRLRSKISGASRLDPVTQDSLQIFPYLLRYVFKEVLNELNIPYTICEFEADDEIAAMARHLQCPVLSYDSDFFIYNVLYIPFNTVEIKPKPIEHNGTKVHAIHCKLYTVKGLCDHFGGLKEELLPLLATLLGNDYAEKKVFRKFFSQLKLQKSRKRKNEQQRCIHAMFNWLKNETLDSAIEKILGRLKKHQKNKIHLIITRSIDSYNSNHCRSLLFFDIPDETTRKVENIVIPETSSTIGLEENSQEDDEDDGDLFEDKDDSSDSTGSEASSVEESDENSVPDWFADRVRTHLIPPCYLNIFTLHLHFCSPQAEDYSDTDSFLCALPILRYGFDMLTDFEHDSFTYVSREGNNEYRRIFIDKEYSTPRLINAPFYELSEEQLKSCFMHFLQQHFSNLDISDFDMLPTNFKLYMIAILWWIAKCDVPLTHVHSLLLCYVVLEVIDEKTGTFRGHNHFNNKFSKKIEEFKRRPVNQVTEDVCLNKNKVNYEDCMVAASVLLKHFEIDNSIKKRPKSYDVKRIHSFAQFQCCLGQLNSLNKLCCKNFETTIYSKSYNGTFVYNIALKLENQNPTEYLDQYLKGATTVLMFYKNLCTVFSKLLEKLDLKTKTCLPKKVTRRGRRKNKTELKEINFLVKGFESEVVI
ncbi:protein asteroid-like [Epargyreus clarus]|uniref:protein asteroid-like n=1 Tax=Epargyreus clarus TaxID=520877 RepID=UPI003C2F8699